MSINFNGPVHITGEHAHVGDNHYYATPADFYKATPAVQYTKTEKELVDLIYDKAPTEDERQQILTSLREIKENEGADQPTESVKKNSSRIKKFLRSVGTEVAAKLIVELGPKLLQYASDYVS